MDVSASGKHASFAFLFTDIEGSTRLSQQFPGAMAAALAIHDDILSRAVRAYGGQIYRSAGDAVQAYFPFTTSAVSAAIDAQLALTEIDWSIPGGLRVRMAIHVARAEQTALGDYRSPQLQHLEAILPLAHGGQMLLSSAAAEELGCALPAKTSLLDLGSWKLPEMGRSALLFQLVHERLHSRFPALNAFPATTSNLEGKVGRFIGRKHELRALHALLDQPGSHLITLTGPGGIGKTRLAQQLAIELQASRGANVWFVELAGLSEAEQVSSAIASAMQLREAGHRSIIDTIVEALIQTEGVLVLDNFEHLLPAAATVADLLARAPRARIVVTSRTPLKLRGERQYPVEPLTVPSQHYHSWEELRSIESVQLFIDLAVSAVPTFVLQRQNAIDVAGICRKLEGVPLAIELAAPRVRRLSVEELNQRLDDRLGPLSTLEVNLPDRHRAMRASIDWSYELLSTEQRWIFRQLGVLQTGFTLETLEGLFGDTVDAVDLTEALLEQNLVQRGGFQRDPDRFFLLESVRQFALEQLELAGELNTARARHGRFFAGTFLDQYPDQRSIDAHAVAEFGPSRADLRLAIVWLLEHEPDHALAVAAAAWRIWFLAGDLSEGDRWIAQVLDATHDLRTVDRVRALNGRAILRHVMADLPEAIRFDRESLALAEEIGDDRGIGDACNHLAGLIYPGESIESHRLIDVAMTAYARAADEHGIAESRVNRLALAYFEERFADGLNEGLLALDYCRAAGKDVLASNVLHGVVELARLTGNDRLAHELLIDALELNRRLDYDVFTSANISLATSLLLQHGQCEAALRLATFARQFSSEFAPGGDSADPFGRVGTERAQMLEQLTPETAERAITGGQRLSPQQAVEQALALLHGLDG